MQSHGTSTYAPAISKDSSLFQNCISTKNEKEMFSIQVIASDRFNNFVNGGTES